MTIRLLAAFAALCAGGAIAAQEPVVAAADPEALSVAPVPPCHESKCAPSMTISSALSVPGISATALYDGPGG